MSKGMLGSDSVFKKYVGTGATLDVEDGPGATLNGVTVTNSGATIEVGVTTTGATLTLEDGTKVTGGTLTIGSGSTLDIEKGASGPGATLDGVSVTDNGVIDVGTSSTATLTLAGTDTITGGSGSEVDNSGAIDVTGNTIIKVASIVGGGSDNISATGATLELDAATDAQTVNFSGYVGTLKFDLPADHEASLTLQRGLDTTEDAPRVLSTNNPKRASCNCNKIRGDNLEENYGETAKLI